PPYVPRQQLVISIQGDSPSRGRTDAYLCSPASAAEGARTDSCASERVRRKRSFCDRTEGRQRSVAQNDDGARKGPLLRSLVSGIDESGDGGPRRERGPPAVGDKACAIDTLVEELPAARLVGGHACHRSAQHGHVRTNLVGPCALPSQQRNRMIPESSRTV